MAKLATTPQLARRGCRRRARIGCARPRWMRTVGPSSLPARPRPVRVPAGSPGRSRSSQRPRPLWCSSSAECSSAARSRETTRSRPQQAASLAEINAAADVQHATSPVEGGGTATLVWSGDLGKSALVTNRAAAAARRQDLRALVHPGQRGDAGGNDELRPATARPGACSRARCPRATPSASRSSRRAAPSSRPRRRSSPSKADAAPEDRIPHHDRARADGLAEAARDVVLGGLNARVREDHVGVVVLDELAGLAGARDVEERGAVGDARRLLHVVGHDDDRVVVLELLDEVFDRERRDRVERGAGLVHEQHVGGHRDRARDAETLLLSAGKAGTGQVRDGP